ncbi:AzlC family ABC transporter permease [Streptococcus ferus]|uniref:Branched-chain amino acid ABC transporter permease n=1 Tax=Streptococcus ferus TaxID=1345 RepID=A0A2X3Y179_9STRE|nr:AzlC family ABC transporter permease [Streptococcus ferus]SQF41071.1 branched-chain amino acid ABC transporter permease [Streptococcus ferus]
MEEKGFTEGVKAATPTVFGYTSIGLALGIVAAKSGISPLETGLMSLIVYSGSGQFALCALILAKAPLASIALTVFLINLRHFLMNLHTATIFPEATLAQQLLIGTFMTDESYGIMLGEHIRHKVIKPAWMYGNNAAGYLTWALASLIGCVLGGLIPNPNAFGIDFALIAMFVAIFSGQLEGMLKRLPIKKIGMILLTVFLAYVLLSVFISESLAVLAATLLGCTVGVMLDD